MLPNDLYGVVIAAQLANINDAITIMERFWRRHRKEYVKESDVSTTLSSEGDLIKILTNALAAKNAPAPRRDSPPTRTPLYCNRCNRNGHHPRDYRQERQDFRRPTYSQELSRFNGTCHNCGIQGHKSQDCC